MRRDLALIAVCAFAVFSCGKEGNLNGGGGGSSGSGVATQPAGTPALLPTTQGTSAVPTGGTFADQVVALVNQQRAANGVSPPLAENAILNMAAEAHAQDMVNNNYFDHNSPNGQTPGDRILAAGYQWTTWGENIAYGYATPADVMVAWMNSPGHRANILNPAFKDLGVGFAADSGGTMYWVQDFGAQ
jgi:uncharacterized protein YkwD